jgi:hypothetical protein
MMVEIIRANISRPYLLRLGLVSLFSLGLAFWCVYDGMVTYPAQRLRAIKYIELLDTSLSSIRSEADTASRQLSVPFTPDQWDINRWAQEVEGVLQGQRNASTAEQNTYFLQLTWLYQHVPSKATDKMDEPDRLRYRSTLRKHLVKILNAPDEYSTTKDDLIAQTASRLDAAWKTICGQQHWSDDYPGEPKNPYAIDQQFYMAAGIIPFSLFFLVFLVRKRNSWIEGDGHGLRNSRRDDLTYEQIESFDKKRWDKKGIAKVRYRSGGTQKTFVLDDCNYDYQPIRAIVRLVESKIALEQITGGEPESPIVTEDNSGES